MPDHDHDHDHDHGHGHGPISARARPASSGSEVLIMRIIKQQFFIGRINFKAQTASQWEGELEAAGAGVGCWWEWRRGWGEAPWRPDSQPPPPVSDLFPSSSWRAPPAPPSSDQGRQPCRFLFRAHNGARLGGCLQTTLARQKTGEI